MEIYTDSHAFFLEQVVPLHEQVIRKLTNLRNGIQENVKNQKEISTFISLNGIVGGGFLLGGLLLSPVSGGGSFVAAVGSAYGFIFGGLEVVNGITSTASINQKLNEAQECLEDHAEALEQMYGLLQKLFLYIKKVAKTIENIKQKVSENNITFERAGKLAIRIGERALNSEEFNMRTILYQGTGVYQLLKLQELLGSIMPSVVQQAANEVATQVIKAAAEGVAKGATGAVEGAAKGAGKAAAKVTGKAAAKGASRGALKKIANEGSRRMARRSASKVAEETVTASAKVMGSIAVIGIILDLKTIYSNTNDLSKMEKGKLCDQANHLDKAINDLKGEFERIHEVFKVQINPS